MRYILLITMFGNIAATGFYININFPGMAAVHTLTAIWLMFYIIGNKK